jgi:single-stranded-DNA-specific exonuclease
LISDTTARIPSVRARWEVRQYNNPDAEKIAEKLGVSPLVAQLLHARGICTPKQAKAFLNPRVEDLHDPSLMLNMDRAVDRILKARDQGEKVLIYGDYDVDGMTSTVVLKRALEMLGVEADYYIPKRLEEGYGLKADVIRWAEKEGFHLVVTADSGIRAFEVCEVALELGLDLIVTDHHLPDNELPKAYAIVNPKQEGCPYPDKNLAAVGVVFKLVHALFRRTGKEDVVPHFLKLVAIGTIADLVPLTGENRVIAKLGLEALGDPRNVGLKALLDGSGVDAEVNNFDVSFKMAPRMNAVTRMGGGNQVVDLFSTTDTAKAASIVRDMNSKNHLRRDEEQRIMEEFDRMYARNPEAFQKKFLVVAGKDWHRGVIGIVASRLVERFFRPVVVFSVGESDCQGSGRSIPGFHLLQALDSARDLLDRYGGHAQAAGCTISSEGCEEKLDRLAKRLEEFAEDKLEESQLVPELQIEASVPLDGLNLGLYADLQKLAPFGIGNPVPLLTSQGVEVSGGPWLLKDKHLKFRIGRNGESLDAIWWRHGEIASRLQTGDRVDLAYVLDKSSYMGREKLQLTIRDLK